MKLHYFFPSFALIAIVAGARFVSASEIVINDCNGHIRTVKAVEDSELKSVVIKLDDASGSPVKDAQVTLTRSGNDPLSKNALLKADVKNGKARIENVSHGVWGLCTTPQGMEVNSVSIESESSSSGLVATVAGIGSVAAVAIGASGSSGGGSGETTTTAAEGSGAAPNVESANTLSAQPAGNSTAGNSGSSGISNTAASGSHGKKPCNLAGASNACLTDRAPDPISPFL